MLRSFGGLSFVEEGRRVEGRKMSPRGGEEVDEEVR